MNEAARLGLAGAVVSGVARVGAAGRLPRNKFIGIRIPSTLRSDAGWQAGHRAAASALTVAGVGPIVAALLIGAVKPQQDTETLLRRIAMKWLLGWTAFATLQASRAARSSSEV